MCCILFVISLDRDILSCTRLSVSYVLVHVNVSLLVCLFVCVPLFLLHMEHLHV